MHHNKLVMNITIPDDLRRILFDDDDSAIVKAARMHSHMLNLILHEERLEKVG